MAAFVGVQPTLNVQISMKVITACELAVHRPPED